MQYIIIISIIFVIMLMAPFLNSLRYCKKEGSVLHIDQGHVRNARYFGKSFAQMIENNMSSLDDGTVFLSKEEGFIDVNTEKIPEQAEEVVICLNRDFEPPAHTKVFMKEIYGDCNVNIGREGIKVRAVYARQKVILGNRTDIVRWVDAEESVAVYDDCDLGISATAGKRLSIGKNCTFYRLFAPEILIGQYPDDFRDAMSARDPRIFEVQETVEVKRNVAYVDQEMTDENMEANITVLSEENVVVMDRIIVRGDIRSHSGVRVCDNAVICGNIFAENDILIGSNAVVLGNVFAQGSVHIQEGAMIGRRGKISSVIARDKVIFEKSACVFGYVCCEGGGIVRNAGINKKEHEQMYWEITEYKRDLVFEDLAGYEKTMKKGYRKMRNLQSVVIPPLAKRVARSMFFACGSLERVELPDTMEKIDDFAFADCRQLKTITSFANTKLKEIGTSAFENCESLHQIEFPQELESLGGAAFGGCTHLMSVQFAQGARLKVISDHCFRGCKELQMIQLPDSIEHVGVSAFADCTSLGYISIPRSCASEPGIVELGARPEVIVEIRNAKVG